MQGVPENRCNTIRCHMIRQSLIRGLKLDLVTAVSLLKQCAPAASHPCMPESSPLLDTALLQRLSSHQARP